MTAEQIILILVIFITLFALFLYFDWLLSHMKYDLQDYEAKCKETDDKLEQLMAYLSVTVQKCPAIKIVADHKGEEK